MTTTTMTATTIQPRYTVQVTSEGVKIFDFVLRLFLHETSGDIKFANRTNAEILCARYNADFGNAGA